MSFRSYPDPQYLKELRSQDEVLYDTLDKPRYEYIPYGWTVTINEDDTIGFKTLGWQDIYKEPDRPDHNTKFVYVPDCPVCGKSMKGYDFHFHTTRKECRGKFLPDSVACA